MVRCCGIEKALGTHQNGFWLLVTNHQEKEGEVFQVAAPEAIVPYREKVVIEGALRDIEHFGSASRLTRRSSESDAKRFTWEASRGINGEGRGCRICEISSKDPSDPNW